MILNEKKIQIERIKKLKINNKEIKNYKLKDLYNLPIFSGVISLKFNNEFFYMLNINNDDGVVLKYLWRDYYEPLSLKLWYVLTRQDGYFVDIGAHTGIYTIVANINKKENNVISLEPFFINFSRMVSNMRLNNITTNNCFLSALSNVEGIDKMQINTGNFYHSSGGKISINGNLQIQKKILDNFNFPKPLKLMKIDTEGHEHKVLLGAKNTIKKYLPNIIFEINENSFMKSMNFLNEFKYHFYFLDENINKITKIQEFNKNLIKEEGSNCFATNSNLHESNNIFKKLNLLQ